MKKTRIAALLLALLMTFCTLPMSALAKTATAYVKKGITLNVRSVPQVKKGNVVAKLSGGTTVKVQYTVGSWSKITWGTSKSNTGYVVSKYITTSASGASSGYLYVKTPSKVGVNLRSGPSNGNYILRVIRDGQRVQVLSASSKGWTKVMYKKQIGYIYTKYLSTTK